MDAETFARLHGLQLENEGHAALLATMRPRFDRLAHRHENGTAPRAVSAFQLFQTPADLAARLVGLLGLQPGARVLEPSAGLGRILDALQAFAPAEVVAVETAQQCAGELFRQARPGVTLRQRDFLTETPAELGTFDAVAMNPPFHLRADIRHVLHARQFLKPGGKLAALCLDTIRRETELRHLCDTWHSIPAGAFRSEGTGVACILLSLTA